MASMTYRALSPSGDYTFGCGPGQGFLTGAAAVAQAIKTRLMLFYGEWFLSITDGLPLWQQILGTSGSNKKIVDNLFQTRILGTANVTGISSFSSSFNSSSRTYQFTCTVTTAFSTTVTVSNA